MTNKIFDTDNIELSVNTFIDPYGANRADVQRLFDKIITGLLDFLSNAANVEPIPSWDGWLPQVLLPTQGRPMEEIMNDVQQILRRSMNPANPRFIGHMDTVPSSMGILGELISAALNNNMLSVEMSPLLSRLEHRCMQEIASWFGFGKFAGGVMCGGGSLSNLQAIAVARNTALQCQSSGLARNATRPVFFASTVAHTSLQKAAMLLGIGTEALIGIDIDEHSRMRPETLRAAIRHSRERGERPFCVVATAGTTTTGSIDPLKEIAMICHEESLWFHVDAAYGGALMLSDRYRHLLDGIDKADSITFNPQKWLYVPKTCAMLLFRDQARWQNAFRIGAPYMGNNDDLVNSGEVSIQGTRHADVLKLWLSLQHMGSTGIDGLIDRCMHLTNVFTDHINARPYLMLASEPQTNLVCFRGIPANDQDHWNSALQRYLNENNIAFFSLPVYRQQKWLRAVLLNPYLQKNDIENIFRHIDEFNCE